MKINLQYKAGDDVKRLTSNRQAGGRSVPVPGRSKVGMTRGMDFSSFAQQPTLLRPGRAHSERGIALVITLILLSVTLVMAIAFLAISRREAGSVVTSTDTVTARLAADAALANAQAQIIASVLATQNPYNPGLLVSTNFVNGFGFVAGVADPTNVNYNYLSTGGALSSPQFVQNVANLLYLPRAPVFVPNPTNTIASSDFRYYLDLNRNGQFEDTGADVPNVDYLGNTNGFAPQIGDPQWVGVLERPDVPHGPNNKFVSRYAFVAVPADGSLDLNAIHNQALHGNGASPSPVNPPPVGDVFLRNQGVGSWEINLAAFLADLNTNQWDPPTIENLANNPYQYIPPPSVGGNKGVAFEDALALLAHRYANDYASLPFASAILSATTLPGTADLFPFGSVMSSTATPFYNNNLNNRWPAGDNTNHFFAPSTDLFDPNKTALGVLPAQVAAGNDFSGHLLTAGNGVSTYDRYTFYRMLAQLGTDSAPAQNQVNLNYSNAAASFALANVASGILLSGVQLTGIAYFANAQTNLVPWQPLQFFSIAADRLLREYSTAWFQSNPTNYLITYYGFTPTWYVDGTGYGVTNVSGSGMTNQIPSFGITNIPVLVNGQFAYTPAVQRVLQLAANIYDATTNKTFAFGQNYPSVFRPVFYKISSGSFTNVSIVGYQDITTFFEQVGGLSAASPALDVPLDVNSLPNGYTPPRPLIVNQIQGNVYGVPWIIGAKKGFPNFNEFSMQDVVKVTRKLQVSRPNTNSPPNATNQMYVISITNSMGVEFWNSYTNGYTNLAQQVQVVVNDNLTMQMALTNGTVLLADGFPMTRSLIFNPLTSLNIWPSNSFLVPFATNFMFLADSAYNSASPSFSYVGNNPPIFQAITPSFPVLPQILLEVTNHLQAFILDNNHVIDYVQFSGPGSTRNITLEFQNTNTTAVGSGTAPYYTNLVWSTVPDKSGLPLGISTQIGISDGSIPLNTKFWNDPRAALQIAGFLHFLNPLYALPAGMSDIYSNRLAVQAPYTPAAITYEYDTYQANDPLVHYLKSDLSYSGYDPNNNSLLQTGIHQEPANTANFPVLPGLGKVNARYQPWGATPPGGQAGISQASYDENPYNLSFKDPLVKQSDNWDFPNFKLPTVGWLGRVHRGTPWQTVYMKASDILTEPNPKNPGLGNVGTNTWAVWTSDANQYDAVNAAPIQDRLLFDNFSTALNDNATRGQLSVNQDHLAAWSAVLSGVVALTNSTAFPQFKQFQPLTNGSLTIDPAGPLGVGSRVGQLVTNINNMRAQFKNPDGLTGVFEHVGDILSTLQLTEQSPFLNWNNANQQQSGISDEVYEWLPQQTMSLLRVPGTPQSPMRYVIYSYGQTLKPAPNGVVTGGPNLANGVSPFGMVTNYQVVAETATRTVVRLTPVITANPNGTLNTNYSSKIEQFNVLPPD
jgi:hypothetical protein